MLQPLGKPPGAAETAGEPLGAAEPLGKPPGFPRPLPLVRVADERFAAPSSAPPRVTHLTHAVAQPLHRALGLTDDEYGRICSLLGRDPNRLELAVFSLLWSEHCAYKHSALLLRRLPSNGERVLLGPGENAGVIDLGCGEAVAFKVESHNHPSAVEPFQGAATGVGGILRDVVAMGARPVALLDGLCFGEPGYAFDRAVAGIGHYGNSVGVPTVGGDTAFDAAYSRNCLVNAMCVGLLPSDRLTRACAVGAGNTVVLFGALTGRDGIGGASVLASQELDETAAGKRPSVQIADPFTGKKLIETGLELVERRLVESLQDLGAAGLASALAEMARGEMGLDIQLDRVPLREQGLEPWEIVVSESQERMVAVVRPDLVGAVEEVCSRLELPCAAIGRLTASGELRFLSGREQLGSIPTRLLTDEAPRYRLEPRPRAEEPAATEPAISSLRETLLRLLGSPNVASKAWIYRRYDQLVGSRTVVRPGLDAAVLRLRPSVRGLALSLDGCGRLARLDPHTGGALAVLEAARNVACVGGEPLGLTDCLNFGSPEKPDVAWELSEAVEGMALACEALGIPIVSGNVSLYNDSDGVSIHPTPVVGCVGLVADVRSVPRAWRPGDTVLLAGEPELSFAGSELQHLDARLEGRPARLTLSAERRLVDFLWRSAPHLSLAHDVSLGGLAVCCAEAALASGVGAELELPDDPLRLFGEGGGQALVACPPRHVERLRGVPLQRLGTVGGESMCGVALPELRAAWSPR